MIIFQIDFDTYINNTDGPVFKQSYIQCPRISGSVAMCPVRMKSVLNRRNEQYAGAAGRRLGRGRIVALGRRDLG